MTWNSYLKSFTIRTRLQTGTPQPTVPIYYKLIDYSSGKDVVLSQVKKPMMMNYWNTTIRFDLEKFVALDPNNEYRLVSYDSPTATSSTPVGLRLAPNDAGETDLYYNSDKNYHPIMTVSFITSEVQKDINDSLDGYYTKTEVEDLIRRTIQGN